MISEQIRTCSSMVNRSTLPILPARHLSISCLFTAIECDTLLILLIDFSGPYLHALAFNQEELYCADAFNAFAEVFNPLLELVDSIELFHVLRLEIRLFSLVLFQDQVDVLFQGLCTEFVVFGYCYQCFFKLLILVSEAFVHFLLLFDQLLQLVVFGLGNFNCFLKQFQGLFSGTIL